MADQKQSSPDERRTPGGGKFWLGAIVVAGIAWGAGTFLRQGDADRKAAEIAGEVMSQRVGYGSGFSGSEGHAEEEVVGMNDAGALLSSEALQCLCDFIDSEEISRRAGFVANRSEVMPKMEEYYEMYPPKDYEEDDFVPLLLTPGMIQDELAAFTIVPRRKIKEPDYTYPCEVEALLVFVRDPASSKFKLDWETYNQTKHKRMVKYFERPREESAVFRMNLSLVAKHDSGSALGGFYEFDASDLGITDYVISLYVPETSVVARPLVDGLENGGRARFATVEVSWAMDNTGISRPTVRSLVSWGFHGTGWTDDGGTLPDRQPVAKVAQR